MNYKKIVNLKNITKKFYVPNSALSQVSYVVGGTVIAQALSVFILPIVSRIYSPSDYGIMAVYASVISILSELAGLRYYQAIPMPKQKRYADALVLLSIIIQVCFVLILTIIIFTFGDYILNRLSIESLIPYKFLIPIGLLGTGFYKILSQWSIRESLFKVIGRTKISQCLDGAITKISLGLLGFKPIGLILGTIVAQSGGIATLAFALIKKNGLPVFKIDEIRRVLLKYRKYPLFATWIGFINVTGRSLPQLFLSIFYDFQSAGLYAMANSILSVPNSFIGTALGQVFLQRASVAKHSGDLKTLSLRSYVLLLKIGFFPIFIISIVAPIVFGYFLGERWSMAGNYAIAIAPFIAYNFAFSPLSTLYYILNRQEVGLMFEFLNITSRIFSFWLGTFWDNPIITIYLFSIFGFIVQYLRVLFILKQTGNSYYEINTVTIKNIHESLLLLVLPYVSIQLNLNFIIKTTVVFMMAAIYAYRTYKILKYESII